MNISTPPAEGPLLISSDPQFVSQAQNWCAAVESTARVVTEKEVSHRVWCDSSFVLIDDHSANVLLERALPRRERLFVIGERTIATLDTALELGAENVLEAKGEDIVSALSASLEGSGEACVLTVIGACGGVGASTLATAIACQAAESRQTAALVDADPSSGGIELILGAEREPGLRWHELTTTTGRITRAELSSVLPHKHGVDVISFGRQGEAIDPSHTVFSTLVSGYDLVVADVPRHLDHLGVGLLRRSTAVVLVVPLRLSGVVAAERLIPQLRELGGQVIVVAQQVRGGCDRYTLAQRIDAPVLAQVSFRHSTFVEVEHGLAPLRGEPRKAARAVLESLGQI